MAYFDIRCDFIVYQVDRQKLIHGFPLPAPLLHNFDYVKKMM